MTVALLLPPNRWIRDEARRRGWRLVHLEIRDYYLPPGIVPRGALVNLLPDDPRVRKLRRRGCRVVRLGSFPHPKDDQVPAVLPDHVAEGRLAAEFFAERGFRHVGYVRSDPWSKFLVLFDSFQARAVELGMACHLHRTACDLLARMMAGEPPPTTPIRIPPRGVILRESTNALGVADPTVAAAVEYLWQHLDTDLSVEEIAREVGMSLDRLKRAFHTHLGRGISAERLRRRIEVLADLLQTSDTPIADLAPRLGFHNLTHLHRQFRLAYGTSPERYRLAHRRR